MAKRNKILSPRQIANIEALMFFEGMTHNEARYSSLRDEQKADLQKQIRSAERRRRITNPRREMLMAKKQHANRCGIAFELTEENVKWEEFCPASDIKLRYDGVNPTGRRGPSNDTAVFDRIDNTGGYLPDNVVIVSQWVNIRKGDATVEQLRSIADFYSRLDTARRDVAPSEPIHGCCEGCAIDVGADRLRLDCDCTGRSGWACDDCINLGTFYSKRSGDNEPVETPANSKRSTGT